MCPWAGYTIPVPAGSAAYCHGLWANVALSGGSTPGPLYAALRQTAIAHVEREKGQASPASGQQSSGTSSHLAIDFSRVSFFLVDERYVPPTHPKSNVRLVMEELFGQEVWSDPEAGGATKFRPTADSWPHPRFDFSYPDTSLPMDQCIEKYREVSFHDPAIPLPWV